jgi:anti-anti-sigma factor
MSLHIEQRESEGIVILDLRGPSLWVMKIWRPVTGHALHQSGKIDIVLNLKDVSHINSTGLGTLVFGLARLRKAGGSLALLNVKSFDILKFIEYRDDQHSDSGVRSAATC